MPVKIVNCTPHDVVRIEFPDRILNVPVQAVLRERQTGADVADALEALLAALPTAARLALRLPAGGSVYALCAAAEAALQRAGRPVRRHAGAPSAEGGAA